LSLKNKMTFDPQDFLALANQIYSDPNYQDEPSYRTIICRSYYAAFLFSREKLMLKGVSFGSDAKDHQIVIMELKNFINPAISGQLRQIREKRNLADYDLSTSISKGSANYWKNMAKHIIKKVDSKIT